CESEAAQDPGAEPRPDHRRLPPADDLGRVGREPRPGGVADLAAAEGARPRPRRARAGDVAALAGRGAAPRQAPDPVRPARVGRDRAGRRPRLLHLPRRVLQRGDRPAGARRGDLREAPQWPDGLREALVPEALREVRRPRSLSAAEAQSPPRRGLTEEELALLRHSDLADDSD